MSGRRPKRETDPNAQPVLQFRYCATKCFEPHCKECGYFWGPGHERVEMRGKRVSWPKEAGYGGIAT